MSAHASIQDLSAFLDQRLDEQAACRVKSHLDSCVDCLDRFHGMRRVAAELGRLDTPEPPPELEQAVMRRIRLANPRKGLLDRLEDGLGAFQKQSSTWALFAVVIALAIMLLLLAQALERHRNATTPIYFENPPPREAPAEESWLRSPPADDEAPDGPNSAFAERRVESPPHPTRRRSA